MSLSPRDLRRKISSIPFEQRFRRAHRLATEQRKAALDAMTTSEQEAFIEAENQSVAAADEQLRRDFPAESLGDSFRLMCDSLPDDVEIAVSFM